MSWIHDLLQKFKKDDEEEYNDIPIHNHYPDTHSPQFQYDSLKDLDTRISYQYPKGSNPSLLPPKRLQKEKPERLLPNRPEKLSERRRKSEASEEGVVKKEIPKTKKEISPKTRGPFHPTEIPSPVFGFNRPKKSDVIVEHELSHFSHEEFENQHDQPFIVEEEPIEVLFTKPMEEKEEAVTEVKFVTPEAELAVESEEREDVDAAIPDPEPQAPKRSRLPFNVMMLKQDKQKWEEQKRKRELEQQLEQKRKRELEEQLEQKRKRELEEQLEQKRKRELEEQLEQKRKKELEEFLEQKRKRELEQQSAVNAEIIPIEKPIVESRGNSEVEIFSEDGLYVLPESSLLNPPVTEVRDHEWLQGQEELLNQTLKNFNVGASVVNVTQGPSVTRFEVQPEPGVKVNKITNLSDDIKLSLAARDIRIEAPIPGKHTIGIEVPNQKSRPVLINEIIRSSVFHESSSPLTAVLGLDIAGKPIVTDLKKMPHGLIAGATGSGKSVCINSILISLLYKASPEDLKLLLIDPKMVELAPYNRIPHLVSPVITDVKAATAALKWAVDEMERRYELFAHTGVRDINRFNELAMKHKRYSDKLPFIVIIIDELADLMMMSPADVEEAICRIAQKARACGIHLIVATQRPSVDVITGLIKANIPTRVAFSVSSQVDSRTIIDISGAEKLLGRGDMLFLENGSSKPVRLQGTFVSDEEIDLVVAHVKEQREPEYLFEQEELLKKAQVMEEEDELFYEACEFIVDQGGASTSSLQRRFKIGYNRAARLMDMLEQNGYITGANGSKPRDVLITEADLETMQD
ncbi:MULTISPECIES: DNA translocase FtsK [Bacillaceae]|uniref:DNA translocase FtsK n=1 Tax=Bacillaceae TaxID=186817 RepID=UPI001F5E5BBE|nr:MULTISPECIES: DNA translocase FtsK [Bacillaceae]